MDLEACWLIFIILITFTLIFLVLDMFGFDLMRSLKIKKKATLIPVGCLVFVLILMFLYWPSKNKSPIQQLVQASMDYQLCVTKPAVENHCEEYKNTMNIKILAAEMLGIDKESISKAVSKGKSEVKN